MKTDRYPSAALVKLRLAMRDDLRGADIPSPAEFDRMAEFRLAGRGALSSEEGVALLRDADHPDAGLATR